MSNKKKNNPDAATTDIDRQLFLDAMADVRPITHEARIQPSKKLPTVKIRNKNNSSNQAEQLQRHISDPVDLRDVLKQEELYFARPGIQHKVQKKLRRGEYPVEAELDLHGYNANLAKITIDDFIDECGRSGFRYLRIIHGKGQRSEDKIPVLKSYVAHWLPQYPEVLAFCSARPHDGGTGALYVLLNKR